MQEREDLEALSLQEAASKGCFVRLVWLVWLPLLLCVGSVAAYFEYVSLRMELHSVVMIGVIFMIYLFFIPHNAYYSACKFKKSQAILGDLLQQYIQKNLLDINGIKKANAPFDQFIKNFTASLRNDHFASVAATVFPTLGILGTFISIALTMPDFSSQDSAHLEREISQLLGGVGTAFYVSIYGIFLSLWWVFFEKKGMSEFSKHVRIIREKTRSYFWTKEEIEQVHFTQSMQNFNNLNTLFSKISSNEFLESLQKALEERMVMFESIIQQERKAFEKSSEHFDEIAKLSEKSVQMSTKLFDTYEMIRVKMDDVIKALESSHKLMRLVNQELTLKEDSLARTTQVLGKNIEYLSRSLESISPESIEKLYKYIRQNLDLMQSEAARVSQVFNYHIGQFDEAYSKKLRASLELIDSETAKIIRHLASLKEMDK